MPFGLSGPLQISNMQVLKRWFKIILSEVPFVSGRSGTLAVLQGKVFLESCTGG